ncbi:amidohydrolase family protein [Arthrobacter sp. E3]|uniref:amidohydrolase family protein n=1 Tax=Arthrobacter sp. E3 TaxID=517402 RepID=UPI001A93F63E|nr:amidohydrolase family protein [Arthrobacter sp. E3]
MFTKHVSALEWINEIDLVDHHCHGVIDANLDRSGFEALITESDAPAPAGTTFFDTQLGFAVRGHCAPVLGLEPFATPEAYLRRRKELGGAEANARFLAEANINTYIVETGHRGDEILSPEGMGARAHANFAEVVRLERLAEELLEAGQAVEGFRTAYGHLLDRRLTTAVGVKSIAAYRVGLDFTPGPPSDADVDRALTRWFAQAAEKDSSRLTDETLIRFVLWEAVQRKVPIQFHIGYGDPDVDLHRCNPLLLTEFMRRTRGSGATVLLLHCYPFHREAGYLAHVFEHVYCDVGLAVNYSGAQAEQIIAESLELTPFHKALFSSDAFGASELYYLGAKQFRTGLARTLDRWSAAEGWPETEQRRIAMLIGSENAHRVYSLDKPPSQGSRQ